MLETEMDISTFLTLQKKSNTELQMILKSMDLSSEGTREELILRLLATKPDQQNDATKPQVIPFRVMVNGKPIEKAAEFMQKCRAVIFNGKDNWREFKIMNREGEIYTQKLRYAPCTASAVKKLLSAGVLFPHPAQAQLANAIESNPEGFNYFIVTKPKKNGTSFVMLHCERKAL